MGCTSSSQATQQQAPGSRQVSRGGAASPPPIGISQPIQKPKPYRYGSQITLQELNRQRQDFWATRVDGSQHMWQSVRTAAESLLGGDIELARAILEASEIRTPYGTLEVCYDDLGHQYKVPLFCLADPVELTGQSFPNDTSNNAIGGSGVISTRTSGSTNNNNSAGQGSNNKVSTDGKPVTVRVRINPGDHNLTLSLNTSDTVYDLKHQVATKAAEKTGDSELPNCAELRQRVMFMGKEMHNNQVLSDIKMDGVQVVQIFLRPMPK